MFLSIWSISFGQKKEVYLNDDLIEITKTEFDKKLEEHSYKLRFELDTIIMNVKVIHIKKGKISAEELTNIKTTIFETTKKNKVFLSRYRFGEKPLFYYFKNNVFLFASELAAFTNARAT